MCDSPMSSVPQVNHEKSVRWESGMGTVIQSEMIENLP